MSMDRMSRSIAVAVMAVMLLGLMTVPSDTDGAGIQYSEEITCYYYTVGMSWAGQEAESVTWDFGDDSPIETGFSVTHRYSETGDYTVTLTGTNEFGSDVKYYLVHIMGYPVVSFESNGGSAVDPIQMTSGGNGSVAATEPDEPVRDGYIFIGWFSDAGLVHAYNWSKPVKESITLYAKWLRASVPIYTVSFDTDGGSMVDSQVLNEGDLVAEPEDPVRDGYVFDGWYVTVDGKEVRYDFSSPVGSDMVLKVHWKAVSDDKGGMDILPIVLIVIGALLAVVAVLSGFLLLGAPALICIVLGLLLFLKVISF